MSKHQEHHKSATANSDAVDRMVSDLSDTATSAEPAAEHEATAEAGALIRRAEEAEAAATTAREAFLRAKAETENVRRQAREEAEKARKYGMERFAQELLAVKDSLELALSHDQASSEQLQEGVTLTLKQLTTAFEKAKITEINPLGQPFDPHQHQAIQVVPSDAPPNTVVQVFQKGYLIHDRVLRPAMVVVAKGDKE